jgi:CRISPR-associated autoregulator DevR family
MTKQIASISISGEITLNMHSLNNEGGEGNQIMTRQLTIVDRDGIEHTVNGISGDMFKHIHAGHLVNYSKEKEIELCEGCKVFNPNRIGIDSSFIGILKGIDSNEFDEDDRMKYSELQSIVENEETEKAELTKAKLEKRAIEKKYIALKISDKEDLKIYEDIELKLEGELKSLKKNDPQYNDKNEEKKKLTKLKKEIEKKYSLEFTDEEKLEKLIQMCAIDDTHGVLVTAEKNNLPRKSVIEFGWLVGIPEKSNTETYINTKVVPNSSGVKGSSSNEGQNIFHRPANHGAYAFVCNIDTYRIGFNDIDRNYSIDESKRQARYKGILQSLLSSFLNPRGAMTSSQKPHITDFKGVVAYSEKLIPAPTISSINPDYVKEIETITSNLNEIESGAITAKKFNGLGELSGIIKDLMKEEPYKMS